ncbi:hypothetical protein CSOJ01_06313 [Colletotrichum sojae]|uniref:DUF6546 domain-containing protein n=1 Tax=Colletotrichum sojae TaxID=2175907 RepID=A0A8H6JDB7_9PEZI|nr:hypothetical protein CSOJ01_06313 [Colletotrichum sojae]
MSSRTPNYPSLPAELRLQVLQELADAHLLDRSRRRGIAAYASVCRAWELFFEPLTFKHLILAFEDLNEFDKVTRNTRRRRLVKHIWLRYRDSLDPGPKYLPITRKNGTKLGTFELGTTQLWTTLAGWGIEEVNPNGLTLEFSSYPVWSPQNRQLAPRDDVGAYSKFLESGSVEAYGEEDRFYFSDAEQRQMESNSNAKRQLFCKGMRYGVKTPLPEVQVVTRFLTRRAYTRNIRPHFWSILLKSLPRLQELRLERWRLGLVKPEDDWLLEMEETFKSSIPPSLKKFSLFEEKGVKNPRFRLIPKDKLIKDLIEATLHLEYFSICFFVDADDFLEALHFRDTNPENPKRPPKGYEELTTLTLTSTRFLAELSENWDLGLWVAGVRELLLLATAAALRMPKLRLMEIWNSGRGTVAIFRYEVVDDRLARISWQSTQYCDPFEDDVVKSWRKVAAKHGREELEALPVLVNGDFEYYGSTIPLLKSKDLVIHAVSAAQMR